MRALVTGGAGFIGGHLCEKLLDIGFAVDCLDNLDPYYDPALKRRNIELLLKKPGFRFIEGDICDEKTLEEVFGSRPDYVFHYAARPGVRVSFKDPLKTFTVNVLGTLNILRACLDSGVIKVIFASSSSVYGEVRYLPFDEEHPNIPISPYGVSKLSAEHCCRVFCENHGLNFTVLRFFTVYGPRLRPDLAISIFTRQALSNEALQIFGDGEYTRDFTYVDDIVSASLLAMTKGDNSVYNAGTGVGITINELAGTIKTLTGSNAPVVYAETQRGDAKHTLANIDKAKHELGYNPQISLQEGLKRYIQWYSGK